MKVLVTGSSGHLGEGLVRSLLDLQHEVIGLAAAETLFSVGQAPWFVHPQRRGHEQQQHSR